MKPALLVALALVVGAGEERQLERHFTTELELRTDSFEITAAEGEHKVERQAPDLVREEAAELETLDTLLDEQDPPAKFTRLYRSVVSSSRLSGAGKEPEARTVSGTLEGKRVTFERGEEGYERSCEDEDVRKGFLKRLRAELSLAQLLAATREEELEPGASFELTGEQCARLLSPVEEGPHRTRAKVKRTKGGLDFAPAALAEPLSALFAGVEGKLTATLREHREDDELPRNAVLEFKFESSFDGSKGLVAEGTGEAEDELELTYEGEGTLDWDPESGQVEIHLRGEIRVSEEFRVRVEGNGKSAEISGKVAMSGDFEVEAREARVE